MFPEFKSFKKIPRLSRDITITEKIDGSCILFCIDENNNLFIGSKNRWLDEHNDNHGAWHWAMERKEELLKLGIGYHYGEIWGFGVQRNYGLKEKRVSLFNTSRWCMWNEEPKLISIDQKTKEEKYQKRAPNCCHVVPVLYSGMFDTQVINYWLDNLCLNGSYASPGFKPAEGIIVWHGANVYFKKTFNDNPKGVINE